MMQHLDIAVGRDRVGVRIDDALGKRRVAVAAVVALVVILDRDEPVAALVGGVVIGVLAPDRD
jgi:hypothetical protein